MERSLSVKATRLSLVVRYQPVYPRVAIRRIGDNYVLEVALHEGRPAVEFTFVQFFKYSVRKNIQISGKVDIVEMNQAGDQVCIRRMHFAVHPPPY
jgi:hypothetical protein